MGAGPGDPGLLTRKGCDLLSRADVVVYDALAGEGIMQLIPEKTRRINVGKRSGHHLTPQEEINEILLREALAGNTVVRLKGGDPFLFGRGGEELEGLIDNGISFEIVPGITSAFSVPAYQGIPVTHRDVSASVHVITGHRKADAPLDIDFDALVRTKGTLVFLMGVQALPELCKGLLEAGMDKDMPAAVLENGTSAAQRRVVATVSTLEEEAKKADMQTPAIIVVGKVCALADRFSWFEKRPLGGTRILVTRQKDGRSRLVTLLERSGAEVIQMPTISIKPLPDTEGLDAALVILREGHAYDWIVFTSPTGADLFMQKLLEEADSRALAGVKIAAIGPTTAEALKQKGLRADFIPEGHDGESLGKELASRLTGGERILIPRAKEGNRGLVEALLTVRDAVIEDVPLYDTVPVRDEEAYGRRLLEEGAIDYVVFTSASAVRAFADALKDTRAVYNTMEAVCIGRQTEAEAKKLGMKTHVSAETTMQSICEKLVSLAGQDHIEPCF